MVWRAGVGWHGRLIRHRFHTLRKAARTLQRWARARIARLRFIYAVDAAILIQARPYLLSLL
jgi:hypothetical protein